MNTPLVEYPNAHATNPYYRLPPRLGPARPFMDAIGVAYARLNNRYEAELVALCPKLPALPSRGLNGPPSEDNESPSEDNESPSEVVPGGVQFLLPFAPSARPVINLGVFDRP
jgi:hypothetical protein